jgi:hypothetical protein
MTDLIIKMLFPFRLFSKNEYNKDGEAIYVGSGYASIIVGISALCCVGVFLDMGLLFESFFFALLISELPFALSAMAGIRVAKGTNSKGDAKLVVNRVKKSTLHWWFLVMISISVASLDKELLFVFVGVVIATITVTLNSIKVIRLAN